MTTAERNKHLRELANEIAASVARVLGFDFTPKCHRITRRRGRGSVRGFSVPSWAATGPTDYFAYYVAHEVCHTAGNYAHDEKFRALELKALASLGLKPIYQNGGKGPYVEELHDYTTGKPLVRREGLNNPIALT